MALAIILIAASLTGLIYGRMKKNKILIVSSVLVFAIIVIILIVYSINPY